MFSKTRLASSLLVALGLLYSLGAAPVFADDATLPVDATLEERLAYGEAHPDDDLGTHTAGSSMEGEPLAAALDARSANRSPYWGGSSASKTFYNGYDEVFASPALRSLTSRSGRGRSIGIGSKTQAWMLSFCVSRIQRVILTNSLSAI
mgnify:CR=1 FL=1